MLLEFMPLNEFGGTDSWGYDPRYHGAPDKVWNSFKNLKSWYLLHSKGNRGHL
jgi:1,4-alpha-glucan branching enzyme